MPRVQLHLIYTEDPETTCQQRALARSLGLSISSRSTRVCSHILLRMALILGKVSTANELCSSSIHSQCFIHVARPWTAPLLKPHLHTRTDDDKATMRRSPPKVLRAFVSVPR